MKTLAAFAIAGTLTLAAIGASATSASANGWDRGNAIGAFALGTAVGLGVGALAAQPRDFDETPRYVRHAGWNAHVSYCLDRHRNYDPRSDTYVGRYGEVRRCYGSY